MAKNKPVMKRSLPPLNALKAFEAAARNLSFTEAAAELNVTQSAISKQIQLLEEYLAASLFDRMPRNVTLSPVGEKFFAGINEAFNIIETATGLARTDADDDNTLVICAMPSLATYWLIPRIEEFNNLYPHLKIEVVSGRNPIEALRSQDANIALTRIEGKLRGIEKQLLIKEELLLVCHPGLLNQGTPVSKIEDIHQYTLLEHTDRPVRSDTWFANAGLNNIAFANILGFEHLFMIVQAVKQKLGVTFLPRFMIENELKNGELVNILDASYVTDYRYYALSPTRYNWLPKMRAFSNWIKDTM